MIVRIVILISILNYKRTICNYKAAVPKTA